MMSGVAAALLLSMAAQAPDEQWRLAALGGDAPNRTVFFVDAARVERSGDRVRFWTQTIMERAPAPRAAALSRAVCCVAAARGARWGGRVRVWTQTIMESAPAPGAFDRSVILREGDCSA